MSLRPDVFAAVETLSHHPSKFFDGEDDEIKARWEVLAPGICRLRFHGDEPVRNLLRRSGTTIVGAHYSYKLGGFAVYESQLERRFACLLDCHPAVLSYRTQSETITFGANNFHTPDFFVSLRSGQDLLIEIKRRDQLQPPAGRFGNDPRAEHLSIKAQELRARLRTIREVYRSIGFLWKVLTETEIAAMGDFAVVSEIVANGGRHVSRDERQALFRRLNAGSADLADCASLLTESEHPKGAVLSLVLEGAISVPLNRPLGEATEVHLLDGERLCGNA